MLQGKQVVRLKGGCPSVFSRGSSEIAALTQAGITLELVPGVSSALAAPLLAGDYCIALTEMCFTSMLTCMCCISRSCHDMLDVQHACCTAMSDVVMFWQYKRRDS